MNALIFHTSRNKNTTPIYRMNRQKLRKYLRLNRTLPCTEKNKHKYRNMKEITSVKLRPTKWKNHLERDIN